MARVRWGSFSGGLWLPSDPDASAVQADFAVPADALLEASNVEFLDSGAVRGRRGHRKLYQQALAAPIVGIFKHYPRTGPRVGGIADVANTVVNSGSGEDWQDIDEIGLRDDVGAYCELATPGQSSKGLLTLNPYIGIQEIPDAPLMGIVVEVVRRAVPAGGIYDKTVQLYRAGALTGENKALTTVEWPTRWATMYYGGPGDKWGLDSLTVAQVNAADFGVFIAVQTELAIQQAQIDYVNIYAYIDFELAPTLFLVSNPSSIPNFYKPAGDGDGYVLDAASTLPTTFPVRAVPWQELDATFVFDGANAVRRYDGRQWVTGPLDARKGPYAALWRNRLWATDPAELAFSVYASGINDVESWRPELQLSVGDPRAGTITGLESDGDRLVILKDSGVWTFEGDVEFGGVLTQVAEIGCVAPRSVTVLPEGIAYVSEDGVFLLPRGGVTPVELSRAIRPLFRGRAGGTKYTGAVMAYVRTRRQLWLKLAPTDSGVYLATYLSGEDGAKIAWSYIPEIDMDAVASLDGEGDDSDLLIGGSDGWLRQYDYGSDDDGAAINIRVRTAAKQLDQGNARGAVRRIYAIGRTTGDVTMGVRYDNETADAAEATADLGAAPAIQHPRVTLAGLDHAGRFASLFLETASGPEFELHQLEAEFVARTGLRWTP